MAFEEIALGNDLEPDILIRHKNQSTGVKEPATGLDAITAWLSSKENGSNVLGSSTTQLQERAGAPGRYYGVMDASVIDLALSSYVGRVVYIIYARSGDIVENEPRVVKASKRVS